MPVFNSMKRPEVKPWGVVVTTAMLIALSVYTGTGKGQALLHTIACLFSAAAAAALTALEL